MELRTLSPVAVLALSLFLAANGALRAQSGSAEYGNQGAQAPTAKLVLAEGLKLETQLRRPISLALSTDGKLLVVANRDSGTVSLIDTQNRRLVAEHPLGKRLSDVVALPDGQSYLATDEEAHELILFQVAAAAPEKLAIQQRLKLAPYPVSVQLIPKSDCCTVASLWSRQLTIVRLAADTSNEQQATTLTTKTVIDLPYAPRKQLWLAGQNRLIVADNFGAALGIVDPDKGELLFTRDFPGHNIRGLATSRSGEKVLIAHQMLNDLANSIRNDIHWGLLMSNDLRWLRVDSILNPTAELYAGAHMFPLGVAGRGSSDPGDVAVTSEGRAVVTLSGVDEVAIGTEDDYTLERIVVGQRPVAVELSADGRIAYVANLFDDSISILDVPGYATLATLSLGPQPELSLAQKGELLFHEGRQSHDGWITCHSCHTDGHTNGQMNDNLSDRSFGSSKRVLTLLGQRDTAPYAWNGSITTLSQQVRNSIEKTMQRQDVPRDDEIEAIAAYVNTLEPPPPLNQLRDRLDRAAIQRGQLVFEKRDCTSCHEAPTYTSAGAYDVGIHDKQGNRKFNPPSLRGVSHRGPLFHDNRAASLEEVLRDHGHPNESKYTDEEVRDLVAFLQSL